MWPWPWSLIRPRTSPPEEKITAALRRRVETSPRGAELDADADVDVDEDVDEGRDEALTGVNICFCFTLR